MRQAKALGGSNGQRAGGRYVRAALSGLLFTATSVAVIAATPQVASAATTVQDLNNGSTATGLAQALAGNGVAVSNVVYTGTNNAAGMFSGGASSIGFASGLVLGSGSVQTTASPPDPCSKGVEGPNECGSNTTDNQVPGDADLTTLAGVSTLRRVSAGVRLRAGRQHGLVQLRVLLR